MADTAPRTGSAGVARALSALDDIVALEPVLADWPEVVAHARTTIATAPHLPGQIEAGTLSAREAAIWFLWSSCRDRVLETYKAARSPEDAQEVRDLADAATRLVDEMEETGFFDDDEAEVARRELDPPRIFPLRGEE